MTANMFDMTKVVKRAYKYRFYPTPEQAAELTRTFGCVRKVWNLALEARTTAWHQRHERVTYLQSSALLTQWKRSEDLAFLAEVSSVPLQQALRHLQSAFARFWDNQARYPRFKSRKKSRALSSGEKVANPRHERRDRRRLARAQRNLSRKQKGSQNRDNARVKVARVYARIADRRRDHLHKLTTRLVRDNQAVVIEDLSVRTMIRNHCLARAICDAAWSDLRGMLAYKCAWYGRELITVDRWYPSSKLCSACGALRESLPLNVREWACGCGITHDRDVNAARNILAAGLADRQNACGGLIRPEPRQRERHGSLKQEPQPVTAGIPVLQGGE
jgi:putative transposase